MSERADERDDDKTHVVVVNDEEQYSIWPAHKTPPDGWRATGVSGSRERCLEHVKEVWTDLRPRSLRAN